MCFLMSFILLIIGLLWVVIVTATAPIVITITTSTRFAFELDFGRAHSPSLRPPQSYNVY